ncbi:hypothetical protein [Sphingobacterium sp. BN32]|uniref:hypothetical protein n=1 Tax=Sphingobacterium sp. BN32 TaxID=3058432 RepID=UPI00265CB1EE|nr:hypothetical protein [Sphingobacterium sp. BN32]WKK60204.1 hypothetical protein QYC40_08140 [Sphingobacterium sp. BN32]
MGWDCVGWEAPQKAQGAAARRTPEPQGTGQRRSPEGRHSSLGGLGVLALPPRGLWRFGLFLADGGRRAPYFLCGGELFKLSAFIKI